MQPISVILVMVSVLLVLNTKDFYKRVNTVESITEIPIPQIAQQTVPTTSQPISIIDPIEELPLSINCQESCVSVGYVDGRGPFDSSESCNYPEIPRTGICCCIHGEL